MRSALKNDDGPFAASSFATRLVESPSELVLTVRPPRISNASTGNPTRARPPSVVVLPVPRNSQRRSDQVEPSAASTAMTTIAITGYSLQMSPATSVGYIR